MWTERNILDDVGYAQNRTKKIKQVFTKMKLHGHKDAVWLFAIKQVSSKLKLHGQNGTIWLFAIN